MEAEDTRARTTLTKGRSRNGIRLGGSEDLQLITARSTTGIEDGNTSAILATESNNIDFRKNTTLKTTVIDDDFLRPRSNGDWLITADSDHTRRASYRDEVTRKATSDTSRLEDIFKALYNGSTSIAVKGIRDTNCGINSLSRLTEFCFGWKRTNHATSFEVILANAEKENILRAILRSVKGDKPVVILIRHIPHRHSANPHASSESIESIFELLSSRVPVD